MDRIIHPQAHATYRPCALMVVAYLVLGLSDIGADVAVFFIFHLKTSLGGACSSPSLIHDHGLVPKLSHHP